METPGRTPITYIPLKENPENSPTDNYILAIVDSLEKEDNPELRATVTKLAMTGLTRELKKEEIDELLAGINAVLCSQVQTNLALALDALLESQTTDLIGIIDTLDLEDLEIAAKQDANFDIRSAAIVAIGVSEKPGASKCLIEIYEEAKREGQTELSEKALEALEEQGEFSAFITLLNHDPTKYEPRVRTHLATLDDRELIALTIVDIHEHIQAIIKGILSDRSIARALKAGKLN